MKFKLVQFRDGSYGARRLSLFGYQFLDSNGEHLWVGDLNIKKYCRSTKERAERNILNYHDKGTLA